MHLNSYEQEENAFPGQGKRFTLVSGSGLDACSVFVYNPRQRLRPFRSPADAMHINRHSAASEHDIDTGRAQRTSPYILNININISITNCSVYKCYCICTIFMINLLYWYLFVIYYTVHFWRINRYRFFVIDHWNILHDWEGLVISLFYIQNRSWRNGFFLL